MAKLSPIGNNAQFINGVPAAGAKLFTYAAGSSTKQTTYTDEAGTIPQTNPIILDSRGEPTQPIWLTEGLSYDFVFTASTDSDPPTSPIWDIPDVTGVNDSATTADQWVDTGVTPTYVSATQFTLPGDQTSAFQVNRRIKATVTAGTVYGYISVSAFAALTTVTVVLDSGTLDTGLSAVQLGLITPTNTSLFLMQTANMAALAVTNDKLNTDVFASSAEYVTGTNTTKALNSATARARNIVAGTAIATTSGTSHDFTGIPSWVKRITVNISGLSSSGTSNHLIQIGIASGVEATGYLSSATNTLATTSVATFTTGFGLQQSVAAAGIYSGSVVLTLLNATTNTWAISGNLARTDTATVNSSGGAKSLAGTLDRIRLTTVNGTDTFDAGSINILYE